MNTFGNFLMEYVLVPVAHAQKTPQSFVEFIGRINQFFLNPLIVLMFSVALVSFIWGMFSFFGNKDNAEDIEKGKKHILWGVIGMAIMVSAFALINFITATTIGETVNPSSSGDVSGLFN